MFCRLYLSRHLLQRQIFDKVPKNLKHNLQLHWWPIQSVCASGQYHTLYREWHSFQCNNSWHGCCCKTPRYTYNYSIRTASSNKSPNDRESSAKQENKITTPESDVTDTDKTTRNVQSEKVDQHSDAIVKVKPFIGRRQRIDKSKKYTDNNTITTVRAMNEYFLKSSDLDDLRKTARRSPYREEEGDTPMMVYLRSDVEARAMEVWGSKAALDRERKKKQQQREIYKEHAFLLKKAIREHSQFYTKTQVEGPYIHGPGRDQLLKPQESMLQGSGRVVLIAIAINGANFIFKMIAWLYSGSASIFSEAIHSLADTCNQIILAFGIRHSIRRPSADHPYGFTNMRYVSSLISGVGIFCLGAGLSVYHGITGLLDPKPIESLIWVYCILAGSLLSEGATLIVAFNAIRKSARKTGQSLQTYIRYARDPSVNVVLLEDTAAVLGVIVAASCMGLTSYTGNPVYDSVGSIAVGGILSVVATFLIYSNAEVLLGRAIPDDAVRKISEVLENDVMVRGVHDIKATDMGVNTVRFKAEVDFDGREITKSYMDTQDLQLLLEEARQFESLEDMESFMLKHGERIVDTLGAEVDRIERELKKRNPEVRHVDLEVL
ncbi:proton-coupled zinc antiporter SLC30A9, mitochondrial-like [Glandiceps talaboti]